MTENVRKFEKALREREELRKKFEAEFKRIAEEKSAESDTEAIAKAAQALGYDFTVADAAIRKYCGECDMQQEKRKEPCP